MLENELSCILALIGFESGTCTKLYRLYMTRPDMPHLGMLRIKKKSLTRRPWSLNTTKIPLIWGQFPESGLGAEGLWVEDLGAEGFGVEGLGAEGFGVEGLRAADFA